MANGSFYKDQVDDYLQNHYQLLYDKKLSDKLSFSGALHYTKGKGYYEEFRKGDAVKNYGLSPVMLLAQIPLKRYRSGASSLVR
jgi:iron complex outermembrane receptor protein